MTYKDKHDYKEWMVSHSMLMLECKHDDMKVVYSVIMLMGIQISPK